MENNKAAQRLQLWTAGRMKEMAPKDTELIYIVNICGRREQSGDFQFCFEKKRI